MKMARVEEVWCKLCKMIEIHQEKVDMGTTIPWKECPWAKVQTSQ